MKNEVVIMPDGSKRTCEEFLDIFLNTRDITNYLDALSAIRERSLIILSVKDIPGNKMANDIFDKIKSIGFGGLTKELWRTYIGVIDRGNILYDSSSDRADLPSELSMDISGQILYVLSQLRGIGKAVISINDVDYCISGRGWNIVVFDFESKAVIDSATYDGHAVIPTFYHKLLEFDKQYFDDHFYILEKYKKDWAARYQRSYFSNRKLGHREIDNGIIEPVKIKNGKGSEGVCDENFNFVAGHVKFFGNENEWSECYRVDDADIDYIDETVIYGGALMNHPGHLIIDSGAEYLWWVLQNKESEYRIAVTSTPIVFVNEHPFKFINEFLEAMNIPLSRFIFVEKPTKFKKIIVPDQSNYLLEWSIVYEYTREFAYVYEHIRKNVTLGSKKKLYLTKTKTVKKI